MTIESNQPLFYSLSIGAKRQFLFPVWEKRGGTPISHLFTDETRAAFRDTKGLISKSAASKIRKAVDWLTTAAVQKQIFVKDLNKLISFKINFITLTLPCAQGDVTDNAIKNKCLNLFLTTCRQKFNMNNYIWKAESQENGNIHFHLTTDIYIHWKETRDIWNRCLESFGFITRYRLNMIEHHKNGFNYREDLAEQWPRDKQYQAYLYGCRTDWSDPNTTDVHAVKKITNLAGYLTKYFCKNDTERRNITGRLWGMSTNLSKIIKAKIEIVSEIFSDLNCGFIQNKLVRVACDYGVSYRATASEIITFVGGKLGDIFKTMLKYMQNPPPILTQEMLTF